MEISWCVQGPGRGGSTDQKCVFLFLLVLTSSWTWHRADADVSCVFLESCMLPCTFPPGDDVIIHWIQLKNGEVYAHSYYENKDQLDHQDQRYRNRTSLFKSQISERNASLLLRGVEVQDQGRYKCYTSTSSGRQQSTINLKVEDSKKVRCVFNESCVLPCSFIKAINDPSLIIHWQVKDNEIYAHSYYEGSDQFGNQDKRFQNRTSLFKDQFPNRNASLQLKRVEVQDEGTYQCYIRVNTQPAQIWSIKLKVDAPVRKVDIRQVGDKITCSSEGIYPEPRITWSTGTPQTNSSVQQSEQQLYSIRSSLVVADQNYSCTVRTPTSQKRATWFPPTSINSSNSEVTISCTSTKTPLTGLVWRFNHRDLILDQTRTNTVWGDGWRQKVEHVSESGSLKLRPPLQEGMYTCEVSDDEEMYITNHHLRIQDGPGDLHVAGIVGVILLVVAVVVGVLVVVCLRRNKRHKKKEKKVEEEEGISLK